MAKELKTVRLSPEALAILAALAKKDDRKEGYIIEQLILEKGNKEKIKLPKS